LNFVLGELYCIKSKQNPLYSSFKSFARQFRSLVAL